MAIPCLPDDSFEIYLTGSMYSLVGPEVTRAVKSFNGLKCKFSKKSFT